MEIKNYNSTNFGMAKLADEAVPVVKKALSAAINAGDNQTANKIANSITEIKDLWPKCTLLVNPRTGQFELVRPVTEKMQNGNYVMKNVYDKLDYSAANWQKAASATPQEIGADLEEIAKELAQKYYKKDWFNTNMPQRLGNKTIEQFLQDM